MLLEKQLNEDPKENQFICWLFDHGLIPLFTIVGFRKFSDNFPAILLQWDNLDSKTTLKPLEFTK